MVLHDDRKGFPTFGHERTMSAPAVHAAVSAERLFKEHAAFVARLLYRLGVASDELDDAVQKVFLVVHRNGGYLPGPAKPTTYLANIAVRAASSHRRRSLARRNRVDSRLPEKLAGGKSPIEILEQSETSRLLEMALDRLEPD